MTVWSVPGHDIFQRWQLTQLALAAVLVRQLHPPLILFTDPTAWAVLGACGMPFDEVETTWLPTRLRDADPRLWCLGKIAAYEALANRDEPFVHIDNDAFLFRPLPERIQASGLFAQSNEKFFTLEGPAAKRQHFRWVYSIHELRKLPYLPPEANALLRRPTQTAANMGVFGGCDLDLIRAYAETVLETFCDCQKNKKALADILSRQHNGGFHFSCVVEQWMIGVALVKAGKHIEYLLDPLETVSHFSSRDSAAERGYVHFWGQSKHHWKNIAWADQELRRRDPALFSRIEKVCQARQYLDRPSGGFMAVPQSY